MKCILCGGDSFETIAQKLRHNVARRVVRCHGCSLISLEDPEKTTVDYSAEDYRKKHGPVLGRESSPRELFDISLPQQARRIERLSHLLGRNKRLLEIGCSTGHFLAATKGMVKEAVGVELNPHHARFAREELGLTVWEQGIEKLDAGVTKFDTIVLFQVLEHIHEPLSFLNTCRSLLSPGGRMFVEVPNHDDVLLSVFKIERFSGFYYRAPHAYYYTAPTLTALMKKAGFTGRTSCAQMYSLFNHVHWLQNAAPQPDQTTAINIPRLPESATPMVREIGEFFKKINDDYLDLLIRKGIGETLCFETDPS